MLRVFPKQQKSNPHNKLFTSTKMPPKAKAETKAQKAKPAVKKAAPKAAAKQDAPKSKPGPAVKTKAVNKFPKVPAKAKTTKKEATR
jgi:hypothetical protein